MCAVHDLRRPGLIWFRRSFARRRDRVGDSCRSPRARSARLVTSPGSADACCSAWCRAAAERSSANVLLVTLGSRTPCRCRRTRARRVLAGMRFRKRGPIPARVERTQAVSRRSGVFSSPSALLICAFDIHGGCARAIVRCRGSLRFIVALSACRSPPATQCARRSRARGRRVRLAAWPRGGRGLPPAPVRRACRRDGARCRTPFAIAASTHRAALHALGWMLRRSSRPAVGERSTPSSLSSR